MMTNRRQFLKQAAKVPLALLAIKLFGMPESKPKKISGVFNPDRKGPGGYLVPQEYTEALIAKFAEGSSWPPSLGAATTVWLEN